MGCQALYLNSTVGYNLADGYQALYDNSTGIENVALGCQALVSSSSGNVNIALGQGAGSALSAGNSFNIEIGSTGSASDSYTIRIGTEGTQGAAYIAGVSGATASGGIPVYIDPASGRLGTLVSSVRFKTDIQDMGSASEAILALRPVTFRYREDIDPKGTPQFGLVAEEVERVSPGLVVYDASHQAYSVRYEAVNAMLLNEFQRLHERVREQARTIAEQDRISETEQKQVEAQRERIASLVAAQHDQIAALASRLSRIEALSARLGSLEKVVSSK
jgi:hypothetical protein